MMRVGTRKELCRDATDLHVRRSFEFPRSRVLEFNCDTDNLYLYRYIVWEGQELVDKVERLEQHMRTQEQEASNIKARTDSKG